LCQKAVYRIKKALNLLSATHQSPPSLSPSYEESTHPTDNFLGGLGLNQRRGFFNKDWVENDILLGVHDKFHKEEEGNNKMMMMMMISEPSSVWIYATAVVGMHTDEVCVCVC
jgi:hypothetical protein